MSGRGDVRVIKTHLQFRFLLGLRSRGSRQAGVSPLDYNIVVNGGFEPGWVSFA